METKEIKNIELTEVTNEDMEIYMSYDEYWRYN